MKGLILAGGTATRLFPLTIVTNKHLLPIYDRPMIYYPLETLAGMGIREVLVIVGGKSVGDVVELLGDGTHFGLSLTYRYQRGALGIAHAIGLAREFVGDDAFCCVLGDNILRGPRARAARPRVRRGPVGRRHAPLPGPGPRALRRRRAGRGRPRRRLRGEAGGAQERPHPDRRLLPAPGRLRRHRHPGAVRPRGVRDHRRPQPLHPPGRPLRAALRGPLGRRGDGPLPPAGRPAAAAADADGQLARAAAAAHRMTRSRARGPPPGHRRRRLHRELLRPRRPGPPRRDPDHRPRQADLRGQPGEPRRRWRPTPRWPRASPSSRATSPTRPPSRRSPRTADAIVNFAAESHVDRSILEPAAFLRTGVDGVHVLLEASAGETERARRGERAPAPRLLQVSTDEVYGSVDEGRSVEADPLAPRSPYAAAKAAGELLARAYHVTYGLDVGDHAGLQHVRPVPPPGEADPALRDERARRPAAARSTATACSGGTGSTWPTTRAPSPTCWRTGAAGEVYNVPGSAELTNREVVERLLALLDKPWSLVRTVADRPGHDRRYAMDGRRLGELGWANRVGFDEGLATTVAWYREHEPWWRAARGGDWDAYYARQYARAPRDVVGGGGADEGRADRAPRPAGRATGPADAGRDHGRRRPPRPRPRGRPRGGAVHGARRAARLGPPGSRPRRAGELRAPRSARSPRRRGAHGGVDRR